MMDAAIRFHAAGGALWASNRLRSDRFTLKGINWFGTEGAGAVVDGLWQRPLVEYLNELARLRVNALRLPLAVDNVLSDPLVGRWSLTANEPLRGARARETRDSPWA